MVMQANARLSNIVLTLHTGNPIMDTFTNSEDADEMPHNVAFHQGKVKKIFRQKKNIIF